VDDLVVLDAYTTQTEAEIVCSLLENAGIHCFQRQTNFGAGMSDGFPSTGPREVVIRAEDESRARELLERQRSG
jgi:Putative prokaryotic signal transducing protein